jgi:hypothetical protein
MNEIEAKRIAAVVSIVRPEWRTGLVMAVLEDERLRGRVYEDVLVAAVACYSDLTTGKPGRIHEPGRWWLQVSATKPVVQVRTISDGDCAICFRPAGLHSPLSQDPHPWEPQHARATSAGPTDEQRAAIAKAAADANLAATAAREATTHNPDPEREPRDTGRRDEEIADA